MQFRPSAEHSPSDDVGKRKSPRTLKAKSDRETEKVRLAADEDTETESESETEGYGCPECGQVCRTPGGLKTHQRKHKSPGLKKVAKTSTSSGEETSASSVSPTAGDKDTKENKPLSVQQAEAQFEEANARRAAALLRRAKAMQVEADDIEEEAKIIEKRNTDRKLKRASTQPPLEMSPKRHALEKCDSQSPTKNELKRLLLCQILNLRN